MKPGWEVKRLGEVCRVVGGGTPAKDRKDYYGGDVPWATVRDMNQPVIASTEHTLTLAGVRASATNIIPAGSVIVASRVGLGKVCWIGRDTAINQDLRAIIPRDSAVLWPQYLLWLMRFLAPQFVAAGRGATVQGVTLPFINGLELPLPPFAEQRRIVEMLDEAFAGLAAATASTEQTLADARELFESYRGQLFQTPSAGWRTCAFNAIFDVKHGYAFESRHFRGSGRYVLLTPGNFFEQGGYRDRGSKQKWYDGPIPDGFVLKGGDLLLAMTEQAEGLLGSPLIVPSDYLYLHNQRLGLVQGRSGQAFHAPFFAHAFNLPKFRREVHLTASGVKVRHTSPGKLGASLITFPESLEEQRRVAAQLDEVSVWSKTMTNKQREKLTLLVELKQSLLHRAFTGELA